MQEQRWDGSELLTPNVTAEQVAAAMQNPQNKTVTIHAAGSTFKCKDGTEYRVGPRGNLIRVSPKTYQRKRATYTHKKKPS